MKTSTPSATGRTLRHLAVLYLAVLMLVPDVALAAPWDDVADAVLDIFTGGLTRTLAIIACIALGIAAWFGQLKWEWARNIIVGIVFVFGGASFVDYIIAAAS